VTGVTVASALVADMIASLTARGVAIEPLCAAAGLGDATALPSRIPAERVGAFWEAALSATGDPDLGLHLAVSFTPGALDIVGYVMLSCSTALEALERGSRLIPLLNDGLRIELRLLSTAYSVRLLVHPAFATAIGDAERHVVETIMAGAIHQLRLLTGAALRPLAVSFQHHLPPHGAHVHREVFGIPPQMGAPHNELLLSPADLALPVRSANPALLVAFDALAADALLALQRDRRTSDRVTAAILERLKGSAPSVTTIARALAMSPRSVQRGLADEGTTFQRLLDDARREVATRYLRDPSTTVAHVAWLVGYSEPAAFHRAYRRWTGHPPRGRDYAP
jgi:AraC-like DNA-binding protein